MVQGWEVVMEIRCGPGLGGCDGDAVWSRAGRLNKYLVLGTMKEKKVQEESRNQPHFQGDYILFGKIRLT